MPTPTKAASTRSKDAGAKPAARGSVRHSLNLASVGKALAEVMHKHKDRDPAKKPSKKPSRDPCPPAPKNKDRERTKRARKDAVSTNSDYRRRPRQRVPTERDSHRRPARVRKLARREGPDLGLRQGEAVAGRHEAERTTRARMPTSTHPLPRPARRRRPPSPPPSRPSPSIARTRCSSTRPSSRRLDNVSSSALSAVGCHRRQRHLMTGEEP
jgi:hypothetical protein